MVLSTGVYLDLVNNVVGHQDDKSAQKRKKKQENKDGDAADKPPWRSG